MDPSAALMSAVVKRDHSLLENDCTARDGAIREAVSGKRILVVGAAGSIGSAFVYLLARYRPAAVHAMDLSENGLVEVVRDLRSRNIDIPDFRSFPLDYGAGYMADLLRTYGPYDAVYNFAAIKHVRSEKDPFCLARMFTVNVLDLASFIGALRDSGNAVRLFSVSTDKAANPVSLMGASKRLMEHVLFSACPEDLTSASGGSSNRASARFANVAFSAGSLLEGFLYRMSKRQPLAAPANIRRYMVTPNEAAELSLLSSVCAGDRGIGIPRLDPEEDLIPMDRIAEITFNHHGFDAVRVYDEDEARAFKITDDRWPLLITESNTAGEKPYEEFVGAGEQAVDIGLSMVESVPYQPIDSACLDDTLGGLRKLISGVGSSEISDYVDILRDAVPQLDHKAGSEILDQRM